MVYDGFHNPAAWRCYSGAFSHCCADPNACTCGSAYSRANSDAHTYTTTGVNGYACSYSYSCSNTDTHANTDTCTNPHFGTNSYAFADPQCAVSHHNDYGF